MKIDYEWVIEEIDADGDIDNCDHAPTFAAALKGAERLPLDRREIGLVRDCDDDPRSWAYLRSDGTLPEFFQDAYDRAVARVPQRFHKEVAAAQPVTR